MEMALELKLIDQNLIKISLADATNFYEIKHFLKQHKESSASRNDLIYIVRDKKRLIGLVRLLEIEDSQTPQYWLRGLFIEPAYQQKRLASQLLELMAADLKARHEHFAIWAFPYIHLNKFYGRNGFQSTEVNKLPTNLKNTYQNAIKQRKTWLCMALIHEINQTE
jgi:N-acetylglutamate synthase-like GNAT family acetyltransferase